uniref:Uncharacterized protein n=1 Tax=Ciona intestinalis TaxID=7719 RepID=H2XSE5_CIOIN
MRIGTVVVVSEVVGILVVVDSVTGGNVTSSDVAIIGFVVIACDVVVVAFDVVGGCDVVVIASDIVVVG